MGKTVLFLVFLLFFSVFSASSFAAAGAAPGNGADAARGSDNNKGAVSGDGAQILQVVSNRLRVLAESRFGALRSDVTQALNNLRKTEFEKIRALKADELEKLKDLRAADFENLAKLKKEQLAAIAALKKEEIAKINGLRDTELWKVSGLGKERMEKLLSLDKNKVKRIVAAVPNAGLPKLLALGNSALEKIFSLTAEEIADVSQLDEGELQLVAALPNAAAIRERLKLKAAFNAPRRNFLMARERFEFARERFSEAKQNFLEKKADLNRARERLRAANAGDRNVLREQVRQNAQGVLLNQVNAILHHLEAVQGKNVDLGDVNALIAEFESLRNRLGDENVSKETLVEIAEEIRHQWGLLKEKVNAKVLAALSNRVGDAVEKAEIAYAAMGANVAELKQQGKDTSKLEAALVVYKGKLDSLKEIAAEISLLAGSAGPKAADIAKIRRNAVAVKIRLQNAGALLKRMAKAYARLLAGQPAEQVGTADEEPEPAPDAGAGPDGEEPPAPEIGSEEDGS